MSRTQTLRCEGDLALSQTLEAVSFDTAAPPATPAPRTVPSAAPSAPVRSSQRLAAAALAKGAELDHFQIEREIGRGAMGIVYVARDRALDRDVALKVVVPKKGDDRALERFFREARAQARLASPHVVPIHFIGRMGPAAYFAMELVKGEALDAVLDRGETLEPERARRLMIEIARGLQAAHVAGFIHRDIKPSNVLLDEHGHAKIADFGLAKPLTPAHRLTGNGVVLGTPMYMAPEQTRAEDVDHRADMYALGCSFFHLVTGAAPYHGENAIELLSAHFTAKVPRLTDYVNAPAALTAIIHRLMQKDREDRYASYDELVEALEAATPQAVEPAGFSIRGAAAAIDLVLGVLIIGFAGAAAGAVYLALLVALQALRGQTLGKYLVRIRAETTAGQQLGFGRGLARGVLSAWLPLMVAGVVVATSGPQSLVALIVRAAEVEQMKALVTAFAVGNVAFTVIYGAGLALAAIHPEKRAVHDLLAGSRVVHVRSAAS